ncbi:MAG: cell division protein FtsH [Acidimicrobiaceae bacterium]|nr:ATP-dependent metallopeptidase FtsH/Yme1/Tma family protein [Acidimicrobiales bacterium]MBC84428.1 cell division protein FtsH [Acidimicrobiaceae bacterium]OUU99745.1 MAG: cell division protein FtsH [Acidimicrobiaceae bacterium TMED77]|tara:strand:- start:1516 stop:3471 length:1956 start_codon:yes stop_codon:yes gene_type:complete
MKESRPPAPKKPEMEDNDGNETTNSPWRKRISYLFALGILLLFFLPNLLNNDGAKDIPFQTFRTEVINNQVSEAEFNNNTGKITYTSIEGEKYKTSGPLELSSDDERLFLENIDDFKFHTPGSNIWTGFIIPVLGPLALILLFFYWLNRRAQGQMGNIMSIGRSKAKAYTTERPSTTFEDVAGYGGVKQEIQEVVDFLQDAEKFAEIGARIPKGVLLVGPPGTGKTLIARAVAGEAGVPFLSVTGSDFMEMFVGVGASRVRDLFQTARKMGSAIIFIDEIDSIGRKRGAGLGGGHDEREQTLNQMLAEMDGFEATEGIVMMAATNRPDILDPALLRPGRFDRQVIVSLPELEDREQILEVHAKEKKMSDDVDLSLLSRGTPGMSGADLANLINEAALIAVRGGDTSVSSDHLEQARDRVLMGQTREATVLNPQERERVAYHESGHALAAAFLPNADPLHKVSIIPRGMALGVTMTLPEEDRYLLQKSYVEDELVKMLGGRVAENIVYGEVSSGAADDLARATEMARKMVREWGMSERIGPMAWRSQEQVFLGEDMGRGRDYSDEMANLIDGEIESILRNAETRCNDLLLENRDGLDALAKSLLENETLDSKEVFLLLGIEELSNDGESDPSSSAPNVEIPAYQTYSKPEKS